MREAQNPGLLLSLVQRQTLLLLWVLCYVVLCTLCVFVICIFPFYLALRANILMG